MRIFSKPARDIFWPIMVVLIVAAWSIINPYEFRTWFLETTPIIILFGVVLAVYPRFKFTPLSYWLMALGCVLILIGAHYTYARVPLGEWLKEPFGFKRNNYDRFGHFFQGLIPAILFRELLLRTSHLRRSAWLNILVVVLCMAKSMLYEFAEWWTALIMKENASNFLAMQGDQWDAQADMFSATLGSIVGLLMLTRLHDRQLGKMKANSKKISW